MIHGRGAPQRAPHIVNVSVPGTDSESMLMALDLRGIGCSAGSACQSGSVTPSHVLSAIGVSPELAIGGDSHERRLAHDRRVASIASPRSSPPSSPRRAARSRGRRTDAMSERVLVAMSGGVDSSVAAALLVEQGYDVVGATMKLFCHDGDLPDRPCCSLDSVNDARRVCQTLGVPHYVLNLESAFGRDVVDDFVNEYANGRTPIPCVRCNTFTKFRDLVVKADAIDARWIATGHYARVDRRRAAPRRRSRRRISRISSGASIASVLRRMILPVGSQTKAQTRAVAHRLGLEVVAEKAESQDICFVPDGDHTKIIRQRLGADAPSLARGPFVLSDGNVVGTHDGFARFTIGQRRGLPGGFREPMFVVAIRPDGSRGGDRSARGAARPRRDRALDELAGRRAGRRSARRDSGAPSRRAGRRRDRAARRRRDRARARRARGGDHARPVARVLRRRARARRRIDRAIGDSARYPFAPRSPSRLPRQLVRSHPPALSVFQSTRLGELPHRLLLLLGELLRHAHLDLDDQVARAGRPS